MEADQEPAERGLSAVVHALLSFIPAGIREGVGIFSGMVLILALPAALILGVMLLYHAKERAKVAEVPCWQLQVIKDRVFKLNSCTGEVSEVKEVQSSPARKKSR